MVGHQHVYGTGPGLGSTAGVWIGIEWVRAAAAVAVVVLHAGVPYATHRMPGLPWSVWDHGSVGVDLLFWSIELFIMPLFLWMSGFFAAETCRRGGPLELIRRRSRRLLRPLAFGCAVLLPAIYYVYMCGWVADGKIAPRSIRSLKFPGGIDGDLWGTGHLWFLVYVLSYVVLAAGMVSFAARWRPGRGSTGVQERSAGAGGKPGSPNRVSSVVWWLVALYAAGVMVVAIRPQVVWGFQHAWLPVPSKWLYSATFFTGGWLMAGHDRWSFLPDRQRGRWLGVAIVVAAAAVFLGRWHLDAAGGQAGGVVGVAAMVNGVAEARHAGGFPLGGGRWVTGGGALADWTLAGLTVAAAWGLTLTIVGQAQRRRTRLPAWVAYLSRSSLWVYLAHPPVVALAHVSLKFGAAGWPVALKMALSAAVGLGFSLLTYEALVRRSAFGRWLQASGDGRRFSKRSVAGPSVAGVLALYPGVTADPDVVMSTRDGTKASPGPFGTTPNGNLGRREAA